MIYQPYLTDGRWRGFADFLEQQPGGGYEPVDTKLARTAKPSHVLQLCFYAEQLARIQGSPVEHVHVENGRGERETFRVAEFESYYHRVRERFLAALDAENETYPWPCDHCGICDFRRLCYARRLEDDHLTLVAGVWRSRGEALQAAGIETLEALGELTPGTPVDGLRPETVEAIRHQAELQLRARREGRLFWEPLPVEEERGFSLLPAPDAGDVWFDMEGHPFYETSRGLEYLFGYCYRDDAGAVVYDAVWGRDRDGERRAFEAFVDWLVERRRRHPAMHVYHYAHYERTALTRLMGEHGTREAEIDAFLRGEVLVDLYRVTKQALRASVDSYSIKAIEKLYGFERTAESRAATSRSCGSRSGSRRATTGSSRRSSATTRRTAARPSSCTSGFSGSARPGCRGAIRPSFARARRSSSCATPSGPRSRRACSRAPKRGRRADCSGTSSTTTSARRARSGGHGSAGPSSTTTSSSPTGRRWAASSGTGGRRRSRAEAMPTASRSRSRSTSSTATGSILTAAWGSGCGSTTIMASSPCCARRSERRSRFPAGSRPDRRYGDDVKREALMRFARAYADGDLGRYPALTALLERRRPEVDLGGDPVAAALSLRDSYLFVQGPPGSGKTWQGARMAIALMRAGKRIGVTSLSHKAIHNLLRAIEHEAERQGFEFRGAKRGDEDSANTAFDGRWIETSEDSDVCADPTYDLVAGTAWALTRPSTDLHEAERPLDVLFVDEAGQLALADVLAAGTSARSLVLLGDPNQLPQVSQGSHPEGSDRSVLQHLLGENVTVPPDRGLFLAETYRLRPELCAFTSDAYYEGRLGYAPDAARRSLQWGTARHGRPSRTTGRGQSSVEEADAIARIVAELIGTAFTDVDGSERPLTRGGHPRRRALQRPGADAPLAPSRRRSRRHGRQVPGPAGPVVLVSMASSTPEDAPRGIGFAFDRHRFNVATSRAQCRAILVCSPRLLDADCKTVGQMRLVSAVCAFVERSSRA